MSRVHTDRIIRPWWEREHETNRAHVEAAIPDGYRINLTTGYRAKPGTATARLIRESDWSVLDEARGRDLLALCWDVLEHAPTQALRVTTNVDGWVTDIEDV